MVKKYVDGIVTDSVVMPTTVPHEWIAAELGDDLGRIGTSRHRLLHGSRQDARANLQEAVAVVLEANREIAKQTAGTGTVIREPLKVSA